jgi:hypothetical protein
VRWRDRAEDEAGYLVYARRGYGQLKPGTDPNQVLDEADLAPNGAGAGVRGAYPRPERGRSGFRRAQGVRDVKQWEFAQVSWGDRHAGGGLVAFSHSQDLEMEQYALAQLGEGLSRQGTADRHWRLDQTSVGMWDVLRVLGDLGWQLVSASVEPSDEGIGGRSVHHSFQRERVTR